ncbi:MAG TPA: cob(I)yrinic acid a,c-diamide adenosyltransferase [Candidatus Babeliales bacterium]|nr:cob(I)yrinic acid a,c-diamide adenosyltransferase [Candidatus Babeliales bacterium]
MYTKNGDSGTSTTLRSKERLFKCDDLFEALGSIDELNALLGLCKVKASTVSKHPIEIEKIIHVLQEQLFTIQAELAGANFELDQSAIETCEKTIADIVDRVPPVTNFFIAGGGELAALLDYARTVCRRTERVIIKAERKGDIGNCDTIKQFLNRLSSVLYALTRWVNHLNEISEAKPSYTNAKKNP